ncbi:MAG TPA: Ig-like domain repeat protein, partial [Pseudomonas sp.]
MPGSVEASYVLEKFNGDAPQSSKRAVARVSGELPLPAPTILELVGDVLDASLERAHVQIITDEIANGDLITLTWLGKRADGQPHLYQTTHPVTASEVGSAVYLPVMDEDISVLQGGTLDVSYSVSNDLDVRDSAHLNVKVGQRTAELPAPSIVEAPDGTLDPELVPGDATLQVSYAGTVAGDILTWYWLGEAIEGSDWVPITTGTAGKPLTFRIGRELIEPNINTEVKVFYSLKLASTGVYKYSAVLDLVIGKVIGVLPAPTVVEASGGSLDPLKGAAGVNVQVSYASMEVGDLVTLVWLGAPGPGSPSDQTSPGSASGLVSFKVPDSVIGGNIDRDVSVSYRVKRNTIDRQSEVLPLKVTNFVDPETQLPHPVIPQADAQTKVLNLATFTGNAAVKVGTWPFITAGQRVWLRLEGRTPTGGVHVITLLD